MVRTVCNKCGAVLDGKNYRTFDVYGENDTMDLCEECYNKFDLWLQGKASFVLNSKEKNHDVTDDRGEEDETN